MRLNGWRITLAAGALGMLCACGSGGQSGEASPIAGALPAAGPRMAAAVRPAAAHRMSVPTCTGAGTGSFIGGGTNNVAGASSSAILGGDYGLVCMGESGVGAGVGNTISSSQNAGDSFIAGGYNGTITGGSNGSFIGGGESNDLNVTGVGNGFAAIGAGQYNVVNGSMAFIGAGQYNVVAGANGFVGGGQANKVPGAWGVVGGGYGNQAAEIATVPGGKYNLATGEGSFAAGIGSTAGYAGDFVWSDFASGATALKGTAANQFLARASGGVTFYSSANLKSGVKLAAGSGTWASLSDRNAKSAIVPVSDDDILAKVSTLPISEWSYTTERGVRHVGPMAQDFYAAFNVGEDDRHITSIDEDGVALAAIKALHAEVMKKAEALDALHREVRETRHQLAELQSEVDALRTGR